MFLLAWIFRALSIADQRRPLPPMDEEGCNIDGNGRCNP
jgi:hypothetical protein